MRLIVVIAILFLFNSACRERYGLPLESSRENLLVVEGNILNGDSTVIRLSRTSPIGERKLVPESAASLQIEGEDNSVYPLFETEEGVYKSDALVLNTNTRYRLLISAAGKQYQSVWNEVLSTPDIDSLIWKRENGVEILVSSKGSAEDTRYYKWDYDEVWEFHADYPTYVYFTYVVSPTGVPRPECIDVTRDGITYRSCIERYDHPEGTKFNDSMYYCWKYVTSSNINIGSTAALNDNVVLSTVRKIEEDSWELSYLYSIRVKQTGLSREGYQFYKLLESNSEGLGSIFDAQPSELKSNFTCVSDPAEKVIGYIDATTVKSKRLFISISDLPDWIYDAFPCADTLTNALVPYADAISQNLVPVQVKAFERTAPYRITLYSLTHKQCADCRIRGVHKKPDFWPQ